MYFTSLRLSHSFVFVIFYATSSYEMEQSMIITTLASQNDVFTFYVELLECSTDASFAEVKLFGREASCQLHKWQAKTASGNILS